MFSQTIKITSKNQITLPMKIMAALKSNMVKIIVDDRNHITLEPLQDQAGTLRKYAKQAKIADFEQIRDAAWKNETKNRY